MHGACNKTLYSSSMLFLSLIDQSNADDGGSSGEAEEPAVNLPNVDHSSASDADDECSSSEKADTDLSDEDSSSEESDEDDSSSEESEDNIPQQPLTLSRTPPLFFPMSPTPDPRAQPHEAVSDDAGFNMEGNNNDYGDISGWYMTEEEVRFSPFDALDKVLTSRCVLIEISDQIRRGSGDWTIGLEG